MTDDNSQEFQLNCSFLMQPNSNKLNLLTDNITDTNTSPPYQPKNMARQLTKKEYDELIVFLKKFEKCNLTHGDNVLNLCKELGWNTLKILDADFAETKRELELSNKEVFITYFNQHEVSVYQNLFFTFQNKKNQMLN